MQKLFRHNGQRLPHGRLWTVIIALCCLGLQAASFTVPRLSPAPDIDGLLGQTEWAEAVTISGAGKPVDPRFASVSLGFDDQNVYLALRSELPSRGPLQISPNPSSHVVMDDSLELWFLPPTEQRTLENGRFGFFQMIVNSAGRTFALHHDPGYGLPATEWKNGARQAHRNADGFWTTELAIPAEAFGLPALSQNGEWRILLVRNFRTEPGYQAPFTDISGFMNTAAYAQFNFRRTTSTVQAGYSEPATRRLPARFTILNRNHVAETFTLKAEITSGDIPKKVKQAQLTLNPGATETIDLQDEIPDARTLLSVQVRDSSGTMLWERSCTWQPPPERIWFNLDSYARLEHAFQTLPETIDFTRDPAVTMLPPAAEAMALVPGRQQKSQALLLKDGALTFKNLKMPVPGAVSIWLKPGEPATKTYRRFFSSTFVSSGYIFCQEQNGMLFIGAHNFPGQPQKNLLLSRSLPRNEWSHLVLNLQPGRFETYINGIKRGELDHGITIDSEKLGDFVLGNSALRDFAVTDLALYERPLTEAEIRTLAQGEAKISGTLAWYQVLNAIVLDVTADLTADPDPERFFLKLSDQKDNLLQTFPLSFKEGFDSSEKNRRLKRIHQKIILDQPLPDGDYLLALYEKKSESPLLEKAFRAKNYPWLGNQLGLSRRLLPPFTPLQRRDQTISCLLRDYNLDNTGLPRQIRAMNEDILAGPIRLIAETSGKIEPWQPSPIQFTQEDDLTIAYRTTLRSNSVDITIKGEFEFDGLLRLDLTFTQHGSTLPERIYLDIPVRQEMAKLFHACGEGLRMNPAGFLPQGEGVIWKSRSIPQTHISNFIPYIWVGADERGIAYGADWDQGWQHCQERDAVELHRHDNSDVSIRLNLINAPKKLSSDIPLTLVLMASPVKPMPEGWRGWSDAFTMQATRITRCLYSNPYWGSYSNWTSRYPAFQDFTYIKKLVEAKETGIIDQAYIKNWVDRIMQADRAEVPIVRPDGRDYVERHTRAAFALSKGLFPKKEIAILYPYTCNITGAEQLPEFPVFKDEWQGNVHVYQSYADYAIYYLNEMLNCGFGGVYDDNVFLSGKFNWATGNGYIDDAGNIHPSLGLWRVRNYHKRQLTLMAERGMDPWITVHHTNTNNLTVLGFATNTMGMEWKYGSHDFQERFTPDYIRAVCHGRQGGFYPTVLEGITGTKTPEEKTWATRTMLAALLPHEVRPTCQRGADAKLIGQTLDHLFAFGTHLPDCRFYPYWEKDNPVRLDEPGLLTASYRRGNTMLIFIGSYANHDVNDHLRLNFTDTPHRITAATNVETGAALPLTDTNTLELQLKKHDFVLLNLELAHN